MRRPTDPPRRRPRPLAWTATAAGVAAIQGLLVAWLSWPGAVAPLPATPLPVNVELTRPPPPPPAPVPDPAPAPQGPAQDQAEAAEAEEPQAPEPAPTPPTPPAAPRPARQTPPPEVPTLAASPAPGPPDLPLVGGARLAGALRAGGGGAGLGSGGGGTGGAGAGGACDMVARLEAALRDDIEVRRAVTEVLAARQAAGQAVQVWNGDWLQSPGQAGKGLAGVRQAIAVEVGFSPRECREQRVSGLVVLALDGSTTGPKLALGTAAWRWRDLLEL